MADINDRLERLQRREEFSRRVTGQPVSPADGLDALDDDLAEVVEAVARVARRHPGLSVMVAPADGRTGPGVIRVTGHPSGGVQTALIRPAGAGYVGPSPSGSPSGAESGSGPVESPDAGPDRDEQASADGSPARSGRTGSDRTGSDRTGHPPAEPAYAQRWRPEPGYGRPAGPALAYVRSRYAEPADAEQEPPGAGYADGRPADRGSDATPAAPTGPGSMFVDRGYRPSAPPPAGDHDRHRADAAGPSDAAGTRPGASAGGRRPDRQPDEPVAGRHAAARPDRPPPATGPDAPAGHPGEPPGPPTPHDTSQVVSRLAQLLREDPGLASSWDRDAEGG